MTFRLGCATSVLSRRQRLVWIAPRALADGFDAVVPAVQASRSPAGDSPIAPRRPVPGASRCVGHSTTARTAPVGSRSNVHTPSSMSNARLSAPATTTEPSRAKSSEVNSPNAASRAGIRLTLVKPVGEVGHRDHLVHTSIVVHRHVEEGTQPRHGPSPSSDKQTNRDLAEAVRASPPRPTEGGCHCGPELCAQRVPTAEQSWFRRWREVPEPHCGRCAPPLGCGQDER
jgi:hypothetical protein